MKYAFSGLVLLLVIITALAVKTSSPFTEFHDQELSEMFNTTLLAFTDLNTDKRSDLLFAQLNLDSSDSKSSNLRVYYGYEGGSKPSQDTLMSLISVPSTFVPADFDGDLVPDFLYVEGENTHLCYGSRDPLKYQENGCQVVHNGTKEIFVFDHNGDMRPDLLIRDTSGSFSLLPSTPERQFTAQPLSISNLNDFSQFHSSGFVDYNGDLAADVVLTGVDGLVVVYNKDGSFHWDESSLIPWPSKVPPSALGRILFMDYDGNSEMDIVLYSSDPRSPAVFTRSRSQTQWNTVPVEFNHSSLACSPLPGSWLHVADVNNDGFPDLLSLLKCSHEQVSSVRPYILLNTPCNATARKCRRFIVMWDWLTVKEDTVLQAAFYDLHQDGLMDILYVANHTSYTQVHALENNVARGSCFLSIKVGSGICESDQACDRPYINVVGPTIHFTTVHTDRNNASGIAGQLSQVTSTPLQLPYVQFGLGVTPNFVDSLTVGVARGQGSDDWRESWETIIPNSQLIVVPRPVDRPDEWIMHLYVRPSHMILVTGAVLLGLIGLLSLVIIILHLKERNADKKVKQKEAQHFHFNAM